MTAVVTQQDFSRMLDLAGLNLTNDQKAALFQAYPLLQKMIARATPEMPRENEPSVMFTSEVTP